MSMVERPSSVPPRVRRIEPLQIFVQVLLIVVVVGIAWFAWSNAVQNMNDRNIPTDFGFWNDKAGFDINQSLIPYSALSTYGRAFYVGLLNTLAVSAAGIVLATVIGFVMGVARLSSNWIVARLATVYVEVIRNVPLLLQLLFWYNAVLKPLPHPRQSFAVPSLSLQVAAWHIWLIAALLIAGGWFANRLRRRHAPGSPVNLAASAGVAIGFALGVIVLLFGGVLMPWLGSGAEGIIRVAPGEYAFLNARGLFMPRPLFGETMTTVFATVGVSLLVAIGFVVWSHRQQMRTGRQYPNLTIAAAIVLVPSAIAFVLSGSPVSAENPVLRGFNFTGGFRIYPEFVALLLGLSLYTAAFIAEIVRAGILAVSHGQTEAASALGLKRKQTLKLIVIPQAMRVIVPPLTNQYLNLTKNSSLAVFIGYPDLVQVFAGTVLNQTGAAVQVIAITMAVYLVISLFTSLVMNIYNKRIALVER